MGFNAAAAASASMAVAAAVGEHGGYLAERQQQMLMSRAASGGGGGNPSGLGIMETAFTCPVCDKRYSRQDNLRRHMVKSHSVSPDI